MDFEEVTYWDEITEIFDWARTHVTSTLYICWAAQAGLYHPVSYTHLDVYKRQLQQRPPLPLCSLNSIILSVILDVYKRQVLLPNSVSSLLMQAYGETISVRKKC